METDEAFAETSIQLDQLPYDILLSILKGLNFKDLLVLSQVSRKLNLIANDNTLWQLKLIKDMRHWRMIDSKSWPKNLIIKPRTHNKITIQETSRPDKTIDELGEISYKQIYLNICPDVTTSKDILKKIKSFQQIQNTMHATSTSESLSSLTNNLTLSSLSSFAMPMMFIGQIKDFVFRNMFTNHQFNVTESTVEAIPKIVLFGPGLETCTSCLVTNILWKSEFKTVGMIPGKDGYGSGIKLKLFNHKPFNLTILYTNNSTIRNNNTEHNLNENRLLLPKTAENNEIAYELNPRVRDACSNAQGFIYVVDNENLYNQNTSTEHSAASKLNENYKQELNILMNEVSPSLPLLVLSLKATDLSAISQEELVNVNKKTLSCVEIIEILELNKLQQEWQLRNSQIFEPKMKDITLGFEWILNQMDQKFMSQQHSELCEALVM